MPMMVMPRNFTVRTIYNATLRFEKDVPKSVPDNFRVIEECMKYGATYANQAEAPALLDEDADVTDLPKTPGERTKRIRDLLQEMSNKQDHHRNNFTAAGRPNAKYVQSTLGFDVSAREVEELWKPIAFPNSVEDT